MFTTQEHKMLLLTFRRAARAGTIGSAHTCCHTHANTAATYCYPSPSESNGERYYTARRRAFRLKLQLKVQREILHPLSPPGPLSHASQPSCPHLSPGIFQIALPALFSQAARCSLRQASAA